MTPRPGLDADLATLRSLLAYIAADSLDVPVVYPDGRTALDVQQVEMGEVSAWFAECRSIIGRVEAELARLREERDDFAEQVELRDMNAFDGASIARVIDQRDAVEAECARLQQALRGTYEAARSYLRYPTLAGRRDRLTEALNEAEETLAGLDADVAQNPADSQPEMRPEDDLLDDLLVDSAGGQMTGVDEDLATLRTAISGYSGTPLRWPDRGDALDALARVEAELSRLREERGALEDQHGDTDYSPEYQDEYQRLWHEAARRAKAAEAECARLRQALRPFVEDYDFHAADYLADLVDGEEARVFTARTVALLIEHQRAAREALAGLDTPADSQEDKT